MNPEEINKLIGIIFKKAEIEKNFKKVYLQAIQKIFEIETFGEFSEIDFLEIFGEIGG
ncbi:MAG: hypothetical protein QXP77_00985 [Candidatus Aenigmatarchaeota archaeon]